MQDQLITALLAELPSDLKKEVLDYIEFLLQKYKRDMKHEQFQFDWEGGLAELKAQYSSVDLQHKAMEWRSCI